MFGPHNDLIVWTALALIVAAYIYLAVGVVRWITQRLAISREWDAYYAGLAKPADRGFRVLGYIGEGTPPAYEQLAPMFGITVKEAGQLVATLYYQDKAAGLSYWCLRKRNELHWVGPSPDNGGTPQ